MCIVTPYYGSYITVFKPILYVYATGIYKGLIYNIF